jgi:Polyketide cyclase / dehydrase and lipid transport
VVRNVHERVVAAPADRVWELVEGLGGSGDRLWPSPAWPAMRLDRPLAVGARGGHAMIRYAVTAYEPGRRVEFTFDPAIGAHGTHTFTVAPLGPDRALLRHELVGRLTGRMRLVWPAAVRWLHDALIEDLLDRAEDSVGAPPARRARHSAWVRLLPRVTGRSPVLRNRRGAGV